MILILSRAWSSAITPKQYGANQWLFVTLQNHNRDSTTPIEFLLLSKLKGQLFGILQFKLCILSLNFDLLKQHFFN